MTEKVITWHFIFNTGAQAVRIPLGEFLGGQRWESYTRFRMSARVGDVRFQAVGPIEVNAHQVGLVTEAQIAAGADAFQRDPARGNILTAHGVVANGGVLDTGDMETPVGQSDYLTIFNPTAGTAAEVQIEIRVKR